MNFLYPDFVFTLLAIVISVAFSTFAKADFLTANKELLVDGQNNGTSAAELDKLYLILNLFIMAITMLLIRFYTSKIIMHEPIS